MKSLEEVVHAQINEILDKEWPQEEGCSCEDISPTKVFDLMAKGVIPSYSIITCTKCNREGVLVFQHQRWSIVSAQ